MEQGRVSLTWQKSTSLLLMSVAFFTSMASLGGIVASGLTTWSS